MTRLSSVAIAAIVALVSAVPAFAQRDTETVDRTLTVQPGATVRLKTFSGRVTITPGGAGQVVVHAVRRGTRERLAEIRLDIQQSGNEVAINANQRPGGDRRERGGEDQVVETDFDIQVPARTPLELKSFSAPIEVTGISGGIAAEGFSGAIRLTNVSGPTHVGTFSGPVTISAAQWTDGDNFDVKTFSGDVTLRLPDTARGELAFDSFSGRFNSALPVTMQSSGRRNFRGQLNGGGGTDFRLKTFSGSVDITR